MIIMPYDFETTGMVLFKEPSEDPRQPHIVQAAAALVDTDTRKIISSINLIAYPDGWEISQEATEKHGITTEYARQVGVPERQIVAMIYEMWLKSHRRIGHNEGFDMRVMRTGLKRYFPDLHVMTAGAGSESVADYWKGGHVDCTQRLATPIVQAPATEAMKAKGRTHAKTCTLEEAYEHFIGAPMADAHTALGDMLGTLAVWFAIQDLQAEKSPEPEEPTGIFDAPAVTSATDAANSAEDAIPFLGG